MNTQQKIRDLLEEFHAIVRDSWTDPSGETMAKYPWAETLDQATTQILELVKEELEAIEPLIIDGVPNQLRLYIKVRRSQLAEEKGIAQARQEVKEGKTHTFDEVFPELAEEKDNE